MYSKYTLIFLLLLHTVISFFISIHKILNFLFFQIAYPSGWVLGLKVFVSSSTKCALQFESGYLHFEKTL